MKFILVLLTKSRGMKNDLFDILETTIYQAERATVANEKILKGTWH